MSIPARPHYRGRPAETPAVPLPAGWRAVGVRIFWRQSADRAMLIAAGVTYYMLMALVPALVVFVSLYGLFSDPARVARQMSLLAGVVPPGGLAILNDQLTRLTTTGTPTLSITLLVSLIVSLWSAAAGMRALFDAMNIAYHAEEKRNFFILNLMALGFTLAVLVAVLIFLTVVVFIPAILQFIYLPAASAWLVRIASYALMIILLLIGISLLYRFGPSRKPSKRRWFTPGAALAVFGVAVVSVLFSWYAANFSNYNATYGSLGALVGLLTWIWLSVTIVIVGAELDAELESRGAPDGEAASLSPADDTADHADRLFFVAMTVMLAAALSGRRRIRRP